VTLIDTSAWVEFLRATGSETHDAVRGTLGADTPLHTTDVVVMELLAGARDHQHEMQLEGLLGRCTHLPVEGLETFEVAATLYGACRRAGEGVRALADCLIGASH
jgi:predicted nucleic acid-binding protein